MQSNELCSGDRLRITKPNIRWPSGLFGRSVALISVSCHGDFFLGASLSAAGKDGCTCTSRTSIQACRYIASSQPSAPHFTTHQRLHPTPNSALIQLPTASPVGLLHAAETPSKVDSYQARPRNILASRRLPQQQQQQHPHDQRKHPPQPPPQLSIPLS